MICYKKFFSMCEESDISIKQVRKALGPRTVYRMESRIDIPVSTINKICHLYNCQPSDVMEYIEDPENSDTD